MGSTNKNNTYEALPGYFLQSEPSTNPSTFDYAKENFGLINRKYPGTSSSSPQKQWQSFKSHLHNLIATAPEHTTYKLFYLARHGQGHHNVAESYYGTPAWDSHWAALEGNGTYSWGDAELTDLGEQQARDAGKFFENQIRDEGMPTPGAWVVSPLMRCLHTCDLTWSVSQAGNEAFRPVVREAAREVMGVHTCDRRSSLSTIRKRYPGWTVEDGFEEEDVLWRADHRETFDEHDVRTRELLNGIFWEGEERGEKVVSVTIHSGAIRSWLRVLGHREFGVPTGGLIPVLVRGTRGG